MFQETYKKILNIFAMFIVIELASTFRKKEIINYLRHIWQSLNTCQRKGETKTGQSQP